MKTVLHSAVIIEKGKLLVVFDEEDQEYRLSGRIGEFGEKGTNSCIIGFQEETGLEIEIDDELKAVRLNYDPQTKKPANIELHFYRARLTKKQKKFVSYRNQDTEVRWIPIAGIKEGIFEVDSNIKMLMARGDIK